MRIGYKSRYWTEHPPPAPLWVNHLVRAWCIVVFGIRALSTCCVWSLVSSGPLSPVSGVGSSSANGSESGTDLSAHHDAHVARDRLYTYR